MTFSILAQRLRQASTSRDVALGFIPEAHADLLRAAAEALEAIANFDWVCDCGRVNQFVATTCTACGMSVVARGPFGYKPRGETGEPRKDETPQSKIPPDVAARLAVTTREDY